MMTQISQLCHVNQILLSSSKKQAAQRVFAADKVKINLANNICFLSFLQYNSNSHSEITQALIADAIAHRFCNMIFDIAPLAELWAIFQKFCTTGIG